MLARPRVLALLGVGLAWSTPSPAVAAGPLASGPESAVALVRHEVPADVAVQMYVRPAGDQLTLLVRVPLESRRDVRFPLRADGALDLGAEELEDLLHEAATLWIAGYLSAFEDGRELDDERIVSIRLAIPSDRSFRSYDEAVAHLTGPRLAPGLGLRPDQAFLDVWLETPITDDAARFSLDPRLAHLGIETVSVIHLVLPDGAERAFRYVGDPGLVDLDPSWFAALIRFIALGVEHILGGLDHLLFVLCLVIPFRSVRGLIPVVTAFTVAHSITLVAAALGMTPQVLWFPPLIEALIAASIVWMALENILGAGLSRRWIVAFGFGLVHGFGFSFVLASQLQFAGAHALTALFGFNVGVEIGQLLVLIVAVPALSWAFTRAGERTGIIVVSVLVAHTAWHWMFERGATFLAYDVRLPVADADFAAAALRWAFLALVSLGAAWLLSGLIAAYRRTYLRTVRSPTSAP
ncbi:MAG: HupE/UreJ family protein [Gemmatimonadetes bacterium]|nr:HupE/UreJ family protein [Gemmatimonadota bacterium]